MIWQLKAAAISALIAVLARFAIKNGGPSTFWYVTVNLACYGMLIFGIWGVIKL